jgi:hypothetical protein
MALKQPDLFAAIGCHACHDFVDGRTHYSYSPEKRLAYFVDGVLRTQRIWLDEGLITI